MKLNVIERLITNNPVRASIQRHIEGPALKRMGGSDEYPLCLEIGCGVGIGAEVIAVQFGARKVIAADIDPEQVERAKKNINAELKERIDFKVEDAMNLDEPDGIFDAVFSFGAIHHLEDWRKGVSEVSRVLRKGGEFFFEEPLRPFLINFFVRTLTEHPEGGVFDLEEFKKELEKNSIRIINMRHIRSIAIFAVGRKI